VKLRDWFSRRSPGFVLERGRRLLERYRLSPAHAQERIEEGVTQLAEYGCSPTFPTPGRVVQQYARFIRNLQSRGAEIAVHSYDHVDLRDYPPPRAQEQLLRAVDAFERLGIDVHGFRCPYLSWSDELLDALPTGVFGYSSNAAIQWDTPTTVKADDHGTLFDSINRFYRPQSAWRAVCTPWMRGNLLEIPVCVPDDLQLYDGLHLGPHQVATVWCEILRTTHTRGELFNLLFHPELGAACQESFPTLFREVKRLQPSVWLARLQDVKDWWREKSGFTVACSEGEEGLHIAFICSERATVLYRGLGELDSAPPWAGKYHLWHGGTLHVRAGCRPFIGLPPDVSVQTESFLLEQGYLLDKGASATQCTLYLDEAILCELTDRRALVDHIETSDSPLVRYWPWPNGSRSALSVSGDLDALTLLDYAARLFVG
jgi:peptidoglycan/xylan/chitin deacetylase (PgdA/CDA1 family)